MAGRCRPNTLRAVAFDLKAFFEVTGKDPVEVIAADVFEFLAQQWGTGRWCGWRTGSRGWRRGRSPVACRRCREVIFTLKSTTYYGGVLDQLWHDAVTGRDLDQVLADAIASLR